MIKSNCLKTCSYGSWNNLLFFVLFFSMNLTLYRHWSLIESLKYSPQTACHFQLWTLKGEKKLNEFLAELGWEDLGNIYKSRESTIDWDFVCKHKATTVAVPPEIQLDGHRTAERLALHFPEESREIRLRRSYRTQFRFSVRIPHQKLGQWFRLRPNCSAGLGRER